MKIPKQVKIGSIIYNVVIENFKHNSLTDDKLWGNIDTGACRINLNGNLDKQILEQVFFHEILHGIEHLYCIEIKDEDIDRISHGLTDFLKDNNLLKE